ncbi:hypothetical protein GCM10009087_01450 [Sphingomonas oligophenolica]|uniref:Class IIb bacteriocin, lactobin A/cerein 7B family n=1 Tax=Sphingomonas oligophenolica TaxID=301154 RepID=A0ABU9Y109_9SPHN
MQDLTFDEIDSVNGGLTTAEKITIFAAGVAIGVTLGLGGVALGVAVIASLEAES